MIDRTWGAVVVRIVSTAMSPILAFTDTQGASHLGVDRDRVTQVTFHGMKAWSKRSRVPSLALSSCGYIRPTPQGHSRNSRRPPVFATTAEPYRMELRSPKPSHSRYRA